MKNDYILKMFLEFSNAYGINDTFDNFYKYNDLFDRWVHFKQKASEHYVQLFDYMKNYDEIQPTTIAEFGKGIYDTAAISMNLYTPHNTIIISPYANTITSNNIESYQGQLVEHNEETFVRYPSPADYSLKPNCHPFINDEINTLMTQLPFTEEELKAFLNLIDSTKTLFIGTYGSLEDIDKEQNLDKLRMLYNSLTPISYRDVNFCQETKNGAYLSAIKINSKQKVLRNILTR